MEKKVVILPETTKDPISLIGRRAGICYGAPIGDSEKNYKRGLECIKNMHGRTWEFPKIELIISGFSAKVIREWYTHIGGAPTRLQASTRYIEYGDFDYITPPTISSPSEKRIYDDCMKYISSSVKALEELGVPKEDASMLLPLGMSTVEIDSRNLRNFVDLTRQRMCNRAFWEFRELVDTIIAALKEYSEEWRTVADMLFMPKCEFLGYCPEKFSCGMYEAKHD